jgi:hypothetical protein
MGRMITCYERFGNVYRAREGEEKHGSKSAEGTGLNGD